MAIKKKTPLYQTEDVLDPTYTEEDTDETTTDDSLLGGDVLQSDILQSDLFRDKVHGYDPSMTFPGPKQTDPTAINKYISEIEKPVTGSVWDKQAAYYRQKGEGDVLRRQRDLKALVSPTITLWQERTTAANAKFELLKQQIPETDFSTIFGENGISKIPMPIVDEVKNVSASIKADLRELSKMNVNDPRYDELRKKVEKDQDMILAFDEINQKLLDIRNDIESNGNDSTQWSDGMSESTQAMWHDIYHGEGENIKIIDGKLQWVNPGQVSYEFKGRRTWNDDRYKALKKIDDDHYLTQLAMFTRDKAGNQTKFENGDTKRDGNNVEDVQNDLIEGGFTDCDGKELNPDGEWGPKSQCAYKKYLKRKDDLETAWLNENLTDEQKKEYQEEGILVIKGKGAVKDLSKIGDEPIMTSAKAQELSFQMQNFMTASIQAGANARGDFAAQTKYNQALNSIGVMYDSLNIHEQTSLLFDGMGAKDNVSVNTSNFIDSILAANEGLELDDLIEGGLLESYTDPNDPGKEKTLRTMFKDWYLDELENKTKGLRPPRGGGQGGGGKGGGGKNYNLSNSASFYSLNEDNQYSLKHGINETPIDKIKLNKGEISISAKDISRLSGRPFDKFCENCDYKITSDGKISYYREDDGWEEIRFSKQLDNEDKGYYNNLMRNINAAYEKIPGFTAFDLVTIEEEAIEEEAIDYYALSKGVTDEDGNTDTIMNKIGKLTTEGHTIGGHKHKSDRIILYNDGDTGVVKKLNTEYGEHGFEFFEGTHAGGGAGDAIDCTYTNPVTGKESKYSDMIAGGNKDLLEYDNWYHSSDMKTAKELRAWMEKVVKETIAEIDKIRASFSSKKYTR